MTEKPEFGYECPECGEHEYYYYYDGKCKNCGFDWYFPDVKVSVPVDEVG